MPAALTIFAARYLVFVACAGTALVLALLDSKLKISCARNSQGLKAKPELL